MVTYRDNGGGKLNAVQITFQIEVQNSDSPPSFNSTPVTNGSEGSAYTYAMSASDPDGDTITYSKVSGPGWLSVSGNKLQGTPSYSQAGSYAVTVKASAGGKSDTQSYTLNISNTTQNRRPVFISGSSATAKEGESFNFHIFASDPDRDPISFSINTSLAAQNIDFVDLSNGEGRFITRNQDAVPYDAAGTYNFKITATDGSLQRVQNFTLTIENTDRGPSFDSSPVNNGKEGELYRYAMSASDPDGDNLSYSKVSGPGFLSVSGRSIQGTPGYNDAGSYTVKVKVTAGGKSDTQNYNLTIKNSNRAPVVSAISNKTVNENQSFSQPVSASDPDGDNTTLSLDKAPGFIHLDGTDLIGSPGFEDAGSYTIKVKASDGDLSAGKSFNLTVKNVNRAPRISSVQPGDIAEDERYNYPIVASDPDGQTLSYTLSKGPEWLSISGTTLQGTPGFSDAGSYDITIQVSDGDLSVPQNFELNVSNTNRQPSIDSSPVTNAKENEAYSYVVQSSDPDGDDVSMSAGSLPAWLSFTDNGDGTASLEGTPGFEDSGSYNISLSVSDGSGGLSTQVVVVGGGGGSDSQNFTLIVDNTNRNPTITSSGPQKQVEEGREYSYTITADDPDSEQQPADLSFQAVQKPTWASFTDNGDGTASLEGTPSYSDSKVYPVEIEVSDGGSPNLSDSQSYDIAVSDINGYPEFTSTPVKEATENEGYSYELEVSDPDGDTITFGGVDLPGYLSLTDNGDGTATLEGTPGYEAAGEVRVQVRATDSGNPTLNTDQSFTVQVENTNRAPTITSTAVKTGDEGNDYMYHITAADPDGQTPAVEASGLPEWLSFTDNGDGTATLEGTPGFTDEGTYPVMLTASDSDLSGEQTFDLVIGGENKAPRITSKPVKEGAENQTYSYDITTSDADGDSVSIEAVQIPTFFTLTDNGDGTASLEGTPNFKQAGTYEIKLMADDSTETVAQEYVVTVANSNRLPAFNSSPATTGQEGQAYSYQLGTDDPDRDNVVITMIEGPSFLSLKNVNPANGTAKLSGVPDLSQAGTYPVKIQAKDEFEGTDTQEFTLVVANTNQGPMFSTAGLTTAKEGTPYKYNVETTDPDDDPITIQAGSIPAWASLTDNNDGTATLEGTPGFDDEGVYDITIIATDDSASYEQAFSVEVENTNRAPEITSERVVQVEEGLPYIYAIKAGDPDGDSLSINITGAPDFLTFTDNGDGTASLEGTPGFSAEGVYPLEITTSDGDLSGTQAFDLAVANTNEGIMFTTIPDSSASEQVSYSYHIKTDEPDGDNITVSIKEAPEWLTLSDINTTKGEATLSGTPGLDQQGTHIVELVATDSGNPPLSRSQRFNLIVGNKNQLPTFSSKPVESAKETKPYAYSLKATDPDGDELAYELDKAPRWLRLVETDRGYTVQGTPAYKTAGEYQVTVSTSDGDDKVKQTFSLNVSPTNHKPAFASKPVTSARGEIQYKYIIAATDSVDGIDDKVSYSITTTDGEALPEWLSIRDVDNKGKQFRKALIGTPGAAQKGNFHIRVTASDGTAAITQKFTIAVGQGNRSPKITSDPILTVSADSLYNYNMKASDPDGDTISYSISQGPDWIELSGADPAKRTASLVGIPREPQAGKYKLVIKATDSGKPVKTTTQRFTVTVDKNNRPPRFTTAAPDSVPTEIPYSYTIEVSDTQDKLIDKVGLTASIGTDKGLPSWLSLTQLPSKQDNKFRWELKGTPPQDALGTYHIVLKATDDYGLADRQTFSLKVSQGNRKPEFITKPKTLARVGSEFKYNFSASDPDSDAVSYRITMADGSKIPYWLAQTGKPKEGYFLQGTPEEEDMGRLDMVIVASDTGTPQKETRQEFTLDVKYKKITQLKVLYSYPNPFRTHAKIKFELPTDDDITLRLYDVGGALIRDTGKVPYKAGLNEINIQARNLASGIYIYRIISSASHETGKFTLIR